MDNHVYIPDDVRVWLEKYASDERKRMDNPVIKEMITWKSLVIHILRNERERCKRREKGEAE